VSAVNGSNLSSIYKRFPFSIISAYAGGTTYAIYDAVYSSGVVYRSLQNSNVGHTPVSSPTFWEVIADPSGLALNEGTASESLNITSTVYQIVPVPNSEYAFANAIAAASTLGGDVDREQTVQTYELLAVMVDSTYIRSDRNEYQQAELLARRIQSIATAEGLL
jgi:hypothetical protein